MSTPDDLPLFAYVSSLSDDEVMFTICENATTDLPATACSEPPVAIEITDEIPQLERLSLGPAIAKSRPAEDRPQTLALALAEVKSSAALEADALRRVSSDLKTVATVTSIAMEAMPCDPIQLRPILQKVRPARYSLSISRWSTVKSSIARVLKLTGWVDQDAEQQVKLTPAWQRGADGLAQPGQRASLAAFARYCIVNGLEPADVTLSTILGFGDWRKERTISLDVAHVASTVRRVWRTLQRSDATWPQAFIPAARDPRQISTPRECFSVAFQAEVERLLQDMAIIKPLDPQRTKRYSPYTIRCTRDTVYRAASVVAQTLGGTQHIQSLRDVVSPDALTIVMNEHFERLGGGIDWAASARTCAITLKRVARICGAFSEKEIEKSGDIVALVKPSSGGLSERSRTRVAQFHDPELFKRLVNLPDKLFIQSKKLLRDGLNDRAARLHARALQLAILLVHPLRRRNLAELDIEKHLSKDPSGLVTRFLVPASETKNTTTIEGIVPKALAEQISVYLQTHRAVFENASSSFLFPGGDSGHVSPCTLARNLKTLVQNELGAEFNVHLVRHLVATLLLEEDPHNMILAQQMLGHRDGKTTERIYGHARGHGAHRVWGKRLERAVGESPPSGNGNHRKSRERCPRQSTRLRPPMPQSDIGDEDDVK